MISAVIHTFNEERNIERCLSSLSWVDEIVVIDMGSRDKTFSIVSRYTDKVFQHAYTGFVEPARNYGIAKTKNDWILIVDADEEIPKSLAHFLSVEVKKPAADFYRLSRKNIIFGRWVRHAGWWPDYQIRFFKKDTVTWVEKIHGIPLTKGKGLDIESLEDLSIIHYNYQSIEQYLERLNRYTTISAKELFLDNKHFSIDNLFDKPVKEFVRRFFVWQGYKDGIYGLAVSLLQSFSELITYLKLWELEKYKEEKINLIEIEKLLSEEQKIKNYWLIHELLKQPHNIFQKLFWKIKRKIND